ncbi:hypothetical protein [Streptomyces sp. NPDC055642]
MAVRHRDRERAALAVAGEVDRGSQPALGSVEGVIVWFVLPVPPLFRPVAAACRWARTMVEPIWTSQSMSPAASAWAWIWCRVYRATLDVPHKLVEHVAWSLYEHRRAHDTHWRKLGCFEQALLMLGHRSPSPAHQRVPAAVHMSHW